MLKKLIKPIFFSVISLIIASIIILFSMGKFNFKNIFKRSNQTNNSNTAAVDLKPIAHPINYNGKGVYAKSFSEGDYGIVFEDDGNTGYLYATNAKNDIIFDTVHLYNSNSLNKPKIGDKIYLVWSPELKKAGIFYQNEFNAVVDFENKKIVSRTGYPVIIETSLWKSTHTWNEEMINGLEQ